MSTEQLIEDLRGFSKLSPNVDDIFVTAASRLESLAATNRMHEGQNLKLVFRNDDHRKEIRQLRVRIKELEND